MSGVLINAASVAILGLLGVMFKRHLPAGISDHLVKALGLCVLVLGLSSALAARNISLLLLSIAVGTFIGEIIKLDDRLTNLGKAVEQQLSGLGGGNIAEAFVSGTLMFVIGSLAIIGSIEAGINNDITLLLSKSVLDGILALFLAAALGPGIALSAVSILFFEGTLVLLSGGLRNFMTPEFINELSAVGGILVAGIGLNFSGPAKIRVTNMLPALLVPVIWFLLA